VTNSPQSITAARSVMGLPLTVVVFVATLIVLPRVWPL
jgi:hypothetical protein